MPYNEYDCKLKANMLKMPPPPKKKIHFINLSVLEIKVLLKWILK